MILGKRKSDMQQTDQLDEDDGMRFLRIIMMTYDEHFTYKEILLGLF